MEDWARGWATVNIEAQTWSPSSQNHRERSEDHTPSPHGIPEDQENSLNRLKVSKRLIFFLFGSYLFFFLPPNEAIRCGVTKGPETDPKGEHKANPQN